MTSAVASSPGRRQASDADVAAAIQQESARGLDELLDAARVREHEARDKEDSRAARIGSIVNGMPEYVDSLGRGSPGSDDGDRPVDVSRYLGALRRGAWLIALIVVPLTLTVLVVSLALPKTYRATAKIVKADAGGVFGSGDVETVKRRLATLQTLLVTPEVLDRAAGRLPGESAETLEGKVQSSVDRNSNIINVVGSDGDARGRGRDRQRRRERLPLDPAKRGAATGSTERAASCSRRSTRHAAGPTRPPRFARSSSASAS